MSRKNNEEQKAGKLQWFFFVIVVPLIFVGIFTIVVMKMMGMNVMEEAAEVGRKIPGFTETDNAEEEKRNERKNAELESNVENNKKEIEELKGTVKAKDSKIEDMKQEIATLESSATDKEDKEENEQNTNVTELAGSFEEMDPEKAASISENMELAIVVEVLRETESEARGEILAAMEPETGATVAELLASD